MTTLKIHEEVEAEIRAAIGWYEAERPGLGTQLWNQLQDTLALLIESPAIGQIVHRVKVRGTVRRMPSADGSIRPVMDTPNPASPGLPTRGESPVLAGGWGVDRGRSTGRF